MATRKVAKLKRRATPPKPTEAELLAIRRTEEAKFRVFAERWIEQGKVALVFENKDLSSPDCGRRMMMPAPLGEEPALGCQAPDTALGLGWRFRLVSIARTVDEAVQAMTVNMI